MATRRQAKVAVRNASRRTFVSVGVAHKYSDVYRGHHSWRGVAPGATTPAALTVDYHTGFGTTGRDWWYVVAVDDAGNIFETKPSNARWLWDWFDQSNADVLDALASPFRGFGEAMRPLAQDAADRIGIDPSKDPRVDAVVSGVSQVVSGITNTEKTEGFKQFMLCEEDAMRGVIITLGDDTVTFSAESGEAATPLHPAGSIADVARARAVAEARPLIA